VYATQDGRNLCSAAPLLSLIKQAEQLDVLVPAFKPRFEPQWVPWSEKSDLAFFRRVVGWIDGWLGGQVEWEAIIGPARAARGWQARKGQTAWRSRGPAG
jgi:hypothetical protein